MIFNNNTISNDVISCVDLFCGAGGLTHGLVLEGLQVAAGVDVDGSCRHPYEKNNRAKFIQSDVSLIGLEDLAREFGKSEIKVLAGCAPCQPFSTYAQRYETTNSPKWPLLYQFSRLINEINPEIVTMENVPMVGRHQVYKDFVGSLSARGYKIQSKVVDCTDYGLPQTRKRMVVLASRIGDISLVDSQGCQKNSVWSAIGHLEHIAHGEASALDPLHAASKLSDLNYERIKLSKPGGSWRDWPRHLVSNCHRKDSGRTYGSVYGRMKWEDPAPTMTTQFYGFGNGRFGHPEQNRAISIREGAILQGFPDTYEFVGNGRPVHFKTLGRMIGNAVPVTLGRLIGTSIKQHLMDKLGLRY